MESVKSLRVHSHQLSSQPKTIAAMNPNPQWVNNQFLNLIKILKIWYEYIHKVQYIPIYTIRNINSFGLRKKVGVNGP